MDRIAFIIGEYFIYWNSIILVLGAVVAITLFLSFYLRNGENGRAAVLLVPMAVIVSLVLSRLIHWYCRADSYASMGAAMTDYSRGGFALMGVFFGCAAVATVFGCVAVIGRIGHFRGRHGGGDSGGHGSRCSSGCHGCALGGRQFRGLDVGIAAAGQKCQGKD